MTLDNDWVWHPIRSVILLPSPTPRGAGTECRHRRFAIYCRILAEINHRTPPPPRRALRASLRYNAVYSKRYVWLFGSAIQARTAAMTDTYLLTQQRVKQQVFKQVAFINHSNWRKVESELWHCAAAVPARRWCFVRSPVDVLWPPPPVSNRALQLDLVVSTSTMHWWFLTY